MKKIMLLIVVYIFTTPEYVSSQTWSAVGTGVNGPVYTLASYNGQLYAGGTITMASGVPVTNIAKWNGSAWSSPASGVNGNLTCMTIYNGELIVAGIFSQSSGVNTSNIARWNGTSWAALGNGMSQDMEALTVYNGEVYATGSWILSGTSIQAKIGHWNGSGNIVLMTGVTSLINQYHALAVYNNELYVAGAFASIAGVAANGIARWNGTNWAACGTGTTGGIFSLSVYNGNLYAAGEFNTIGGITANSIAKWNGTSWSTVGAGVTGNNGTQGFGDISAMTVYNGSLYAGGNFDTAGTVAANNIARWDGTNWYSLGSGITGALPNVSSLASHGGNLYAGGQFASAGGVAGTLNIAKWNLPLPSAQNTWIQKQNLVGHTKELATSFSIGTSGYVATGFGFNGTYENDLWEYNSIANTWTQKASLPNGMGRHSAVGFSIGNRGYIGTGYQSGSIFLNDFWEYNPTTNTWIQKANFGGVGRRYANSFSIGNKGYIGGGSNNSGYLYDFWEYNQITNTWTQKSNVPVSMEKVGGFSIGNKGYMGNGQFYEYNPAVNTWTQKANYPGLAWYHSACFSIGGKGYIGTGENLVNLPYFFKDFYEYNPISNTWTQRTDFGGSPRRSGVGFSIGNKGYIGLGFDTSGALTLPVDLWEYTPICTSPVASIYSSGNLSFCNGDSALLYANNGYNYQWKNNGIDIPGATSYFYYAKTAGSYTCFLSNPCGSALSNSIAVSINGPLASITAGGPTNFCSPGSVTLNANTGAGLTYLWKKNGVTISGSTSSSYVATTTGSYTVVVSNSPSCSATSNAIQVTVSTTVPSTPSGITTTGGITKVCPGESRTYSVTLVSTVTSYTWTPCAGSVITSGQGTNSVTILYNAGFPASDTLRVVANNSCGASAQRKLKISRNNPGTPSAITGDNYAVCNLSGKPYSVTNVAGMTYAWSFNTGTATVASGQGTSSITANYGAGFISGSLSVTASNACSTSAARLKTIYAKPATPASITGATSVCLNQQDVPYSITPLANVTNYTWTGPSGSHVSDGVTTSAGATLITTSASVTVDFATTAGSVKVRGNNACASGSYRTLAVAITCREGEFSTGIADALIYPNPTSSDFTVETGNDSELFDLEVYDSYGRLIFAETSLSTGYEVNTNGWADGIYSVVVQIGDEKNTFRLVKSNQE